jgi:hypothetical protein
LSSILIELYSYLIDLTHWAYQIVQDEITEDSPFVLEFGLWSDEDLGISQGTEWEDALTG